MYSWKTKNKHPSESGEEYGIDKMMSELDLVGCWRGLMEGILGTGNVIYSVHGQDQKTKMCDTFRDMQVIWNVRWNVIWMYSDLGWGSLNR